jgi:hypothetical protein
MACGSYPEAGWSWANPRPRRWFAKDLVATLSIHPAMRRRIRDALTEPNITHFT